ncbi:hypothetical protein GO755_38440 [Spirosoma sp. HMF4905]|uniref:Uncharacterized protein n=1 Tax=Spirosoma arboris TaxID=2682092 RepID=A0A7K1SQT3_9BACT|nr:hypothetical protein [Spirosoma arboris]MVM35956.1 hypothetical protein [Spirosoma arboris]
MQEDNVKEWDVLRYILVIALIYVAALVLEDMNNYSISETNRLRQDSTRKAVEKARINSVQSGTN